MVIITKTNEDLCTQNELTVFPMTLEAEVTVVQRTQPQRSTCGPVVWRLYTTPG
jgi:hypothetical protein